MAKFDRPVTIKKYPNRRLFNTDTGTYVTRDNLVSLARAGEAVVVLDATSGEDITQSVLA